MSVKISEKELKDMYYNQDMSISEIGKEIGLSDGGVYHYFKKYNLKTKNNSISHKEFVDRIKNLKLDIEVLGIYKNSRTKIKFKCNTCSTIWEAIPNSILRAKIGCPVCSKNSYTPSMYRDKIRKDTNGEYEVLGEYKNSETKISFKHIKCGNVFYTTPSVFKYGAKCPECNIKMSQKEFEEKVKEIKGDEYEVLGKYKGANKKVLIRHNKCGYRWKIRANNLTSNDQECPLCQRYRLSNGVEKIINFLEKHGIKYETEYTFKKCRNINPLPFDIALFNEDNEVDYLIEYDGIQHFEPVEHFGGNENFKNTKYRDKIKNKFCEKNNIKLIRISYYQKQDIEYIIPEKLGWDDYIKD